MLIEKISEAIGGIARLWQNKRVALADAKIALIKVKTDIEISDIQERALQRMVFEESRKQANIESITEKAIPLLTNDSKVASIGVDWLANFFDKCKTISSDEMQTIWSSMLAGEANAPGTFSKRTVELVSTFDKSDAELFTKFCSFAWQIGNNIAPLIFDVNEPTKEDESINFSSISHLSNIGLITFQITGGFARSGVPKEYITAYYGKAIRLEFPLEKNTLEMGACMFTAVGLQLANISGSKPIMAFFDRVVSVWSEKGYNPSEPVNPYAGPQSGPTSWYTHPDYNISNEIT